MLGLVPNNLPSHQHVHQLAAPQPKPGLTPAQIGIVKSTVPVLQQHSETITKTFYKNMLDAHPELRNVFNLSNQRNGAQPRALASAVLAYATHIEHPEVLLPVIERIAHKHASLAVSADQYAIVGKYLVEAFGIVLGDALTEEVTDAWVAAFSQLADIFTKREEQLYEEAGEWQGWRKFRVSRRQPESNTICSFYLTPSDGKMPLPRFHAGQYVSLRVQVPELGNIYQCRQYSMSTAPHDDYYRVSIKREIHDGASAPGVVSNILPDHYHVGDEIELTYPRGEFCLNVENKTKSDAPLILLSAGVGITPLMSILETVLNSPTSKMASRPIVWAHMARDKQEMAFSEDLRSTSKGHDNVETVVFLKQVNECDEMGVEYDFQGSLDLALVFKGRNGYLHSKESEFFICGPAAWMVDMRGKLEDEGVDKEQVHLELFGTGNVEDNE